MLKQSGSLTLPPPSLPQTAALSVCFKLKDKLKEKLFVNCFYFSDFLSYFFTQLSRLYCPSSLNIVFNIVTAVTSDPRTKQKV